jgi:hypothetical protein
LQLQKIIEFGGMETKKERVTTLPEDIRKSSLPPLKLLLRTSEKAACPLLRLEFF